MKQRKGDPLRRESPPIRIRISGRFFSRIGGGNGGIQRRASEESLPGMKTALLPGMKYAILFPRGGNRADRTD